MRNPVFSTVFSDEKYRVVHYGYATFGMSKTQYQVTNQESQEIDGTRLLSARNARYFRDFNV